MDNLTANAESLNVKTNIRVRPDNPDKIGQEVNRQWIRIGLLLTIIFIIVIILIKEYTEYLKIIRTMSITEYLIN